MTPGVEPVLGDAEARHTITTETGISLFVEAGAGTGKTRSMVERIVTLVERDQVDVAQIAAITFTEAAARELRVRVREALERRARATGSRRLLLAAGQVDAAAFTTLHGFALRLLLEAPIEAGLPPGFGVVDEMASLIDFDQGWKLFANRIGDEMALFELQERADALGIQLNNFAPIAQQLDNNWDRVDPANAAPVDVSPPMVPIDARGLIGDLADLAGRAQSSITKDDELYRALVELGRQIDGLTRAEPVDQLRVLRDFERNTRKFPPANRGRKADWQADPGVGVIKEEIKALKERLGVFISARNDEVIAAYTRIVAGFVLDRVRRRTERGELLFHDLLVLARRLLRTDERVRQRLHQRYTRLLLDEFQDTDPIQIELAVLLAVAHQPGGRPWEELAGEVEPGRLVVVGDPKQSIYRFRRADIATYTATEDHLAARSVALTTNFRSVPGIVEWVNALFGDLMGDGEPGRQPRYRPLIASRNGPEAEVGPVRIIGGPRAGLANEIRVDEAGEVAAAVCAAMSQQWPVADRENGGWRPVRLSDIAVLIPSRTSLPSLEAAFYEASIPLRPETSSLVYATQEVRDVLAAIAAVVDPASQVDVVATLRSTLFAVADDDLINWYDANGSWDYRVDWGPEAAAVSAVASAFSTLRAWHARRWWTPPSAMVDRIVSERRLREVALAAPRPRDRWRRYRFLAEQAREFTETQGGDLQDFVRWAEIQSSELARVTEPILAESDDDAVRLLTIHGSKGLEFPVVILAGASTADGNAPHRGPTAIISDQGTIETKLVKGTETAGFDAQATIEATMDSYERIRLHYVASTRARDHLVVSAFHKQSGGGEKSMGGRTWTAVQAHSELVSPLQGDDRASFEPSRPTQLRLPESDFDDGLNRWNQTQRSLTAAARAARSMSPSALAEREAGIRPLSVDTTDSGTTTLSLRDPSSGTELGLAVHQVLETIDFDRPELIDELSLAAARTFALAGDEQSLADTVGHRVGLALQSETLALAAANRVRRELYVAAPVEEALIEGYLDLCIETGDGLVIVDYKTDFVPADNVDKTLDDKVASYRLQLGAYALALSEVTQKPVVDCRLLFLTDHGAYSRSLTDLRGAVSEVRRVLQGMAKGSGSG